MSARGVAVTPKKAAAVIWGLAAVVFGMVVWLGMWSGTLWLAGLGLLAGLWSMFMVWWHWR